ncbi:capsule polysaccharide biosynthesis domain protein [Leptospira yanagawae serovar Saopaulo str. Sao Paulo = ATCC 700523]|uniref:Capsule polysaccharide biosynthesis domain protein n=1 Tax=Leptospira yanagawae serovar Saopaulo str. Sao Paulo = ATCC 700523 TaxID=1249483 RepID=A0A5E8HBL6_9LEPT|nr:capsule polysaccharide biosynthesis domain protein [Leptospira yanagawae]EOQ88183.1 capsule polysaccharide biosynthesis domain protein [Leptospira yanagawae serovar Saopaulo str. Sao Paulo = ATCC 700523]
MKILAFAPHSFLWPHAFPEAQVLHSLRAQGAEILYVGCGEALNSWCIPMESTGADESLEESKKKEICIQCVENNKKIERIFSFPKTTIAEVLKKEDFESIEKIMQSLTASNVLDFQLDGLNFGRYSLYNHFLQHKKIDFVIDEDSWEAVRLHLITCLRSYFAGKRLIEDYKPDFVFFYSSGYSVNLVVRLHAEVKKIPTYSIFAGSNWANRLETIHIAKRNSFTHFYERDDLWKTKFKYLPATKESLKNVETFLHFVLKGQSTFLYGGTPSGKSAKEIQDFFHIPEGLKITLLATSSYDELKSAQLVDELPLEESAIFENQIEWIKETVEFFKKKNDCFLIIRVHPRELPNQRDQVLSKHYSELKKIFSNLPENVKVNLPSDNLSFYDLLENIDFGLISWSSAGRDMAVWGIPFISYLKDYSFYPRGDLGIVPESKADYFSQIENLITNDGWSFDRIIKTFRWLSFEIYDTVFDIRDIVDGRLILIESFFWRNFRRVLRRLKLDNYLKPQPRVSKYSKQMFKRVISGRPTEEILEEGRSRLSTEQELEEIKQILNSLCEVKFGRNWKSDLSSKLRKKIFEYIK